MASIFNVFYYSYASGIRKCVKKLEILQIFCIFIAENKNSYKISNKFQE